MATTYELISKTTASSQQTLTLNSIPSTYTDLRVVLQGGQITDTPLYLRFNGDSGSNYWTKTMNAYSTNIDSQRGQLTGSWIRSEGIVEALFGAVTWEINNYRSSKFKVCQARGAFHGNSPPGITFYTFTTWRSESAITSISIFNSTGNLIDGTTVSLYGMNRA